MLRSWYEANLGTLGLSVTATAVEFGALMVFVVALKQLMRAAEAPRRFLTDLAAASGILTGVWLWLVAATTMMPIVAADDDRRLTDVSDATVLTFDQFRRLGETIGDLSAVPRGLFILAISLLILQTRLLPRWIAWFGLLIAAASLICVVGPAWWITPFGVASLIGFFGYPVWLISVASTLIIRGARARHTRAVQPSH